LNEIVSSRRDITTALSLFLPTLLELETKVPGGGKDAKSLDKAY
jgi:hypothetical protein